MATVDDVRAYGPHGPLLSHETAMTQGWRCLIAAAMALCISVPAMAQSNNFKTFPDYVTGKPQVQQPASGDVLPLIRNGQTMGLPGTQVLTPDGSAQITRKIIDCSLNTCLNFPGGTGGGTDVLPTTCGGPGGAVEGAPYNNNGVVTICSFASVTWGGTPLTWGGVEITGL